MLDWDDVFPKRLKHARSLSGLSQYDIEDTTGIPHSTVSKFETNKQEPNLQQLYSLALVLNVTSDWLIGLTAFGGIDLKERRLEEKNRNEILKKLERDALLAKRLEPELT